MTTTIITRTMAITINTDKYNTDDHNEISTTTTVIIIVIESLY